MFGNSLLFILIKIRIFIPHNIFFSQWSYNGFLCFLVCIFKDKPVLFLQNNRDHGTESWTKNSLARTVLDDWKVVNSKLDYYEESWHTKVIISNRKNLIQSCKNDRRMTFGSTMISVNTGGSLRCPSKHNLFSC